MKTTKKTWAFNPDKVFETLKPALMDGEEVEALLVPSSSGYCIISRMRIAFFKPSSPKPVFSIPMANLTGYSSSKSMGRNSYTLELRDGSSTKLGGFLTDDEPVFLEVFESCLANAIEVEGIASETPETRASDFAAIEANFPWTKVPKHLQKNVYANIADDEKPLFIISSNAGSAAGALVAMKDRCILIKSGALGGLMTGTLGGARVSSFYYKDITGIEYNSGMITGVVEILTASYNGSANKDFWKGSNKGRNADSNDPWTLSNTLPLSKLDYGSAKIQFDKLRKLISESKSSFSHTTIVNESSVADEISKLSELLASGLIDEVEFKEAKKKLLGM